MKGNLTIVVCIFDASREQKGAREQKEANKKLQAIPPKYHKPKLHPKFAYIQLDFCSSQ